MKKLDQVFNYPSDKETIFLRNQLEKWLEYSEEEKTHVINWTREHNQEFGMCPLFLPGKKQL